MIGIDEAGRGPWAGPVVAAAVDLRGAVIVGLNDSKKLSEKKRLHFDRAIRSSEAQYGLGWVSAHDIDSLGLTAAVALAMQRALDALPEVQGEILIDGNTNFLPDYAGTTTMVGADGIIDAVSAASIIAKVARDAYMVALDSELPGYDFARHKGYGTALHKKRLALMGVSDQHRKSFKPVRSLL